MTARKKVRTTTPARANVAIQPSRSQRGTVAAICAALILLTVVTYAPVWRFDFVALEWFPDPSTRRNVIRIAPGDLPASVMDRVADGIVRWFSLQTAALGTTDK